jgi:hypothetical protein
MNGGLLQRLRIARSLVQCSAFGAGACQSVVILAWFRDDPKQVYKSSDRVQCANAPGGTITV